METIKTYQWPNTLLCHLRINCNNTFLVTLGQRASHCTLDEKVLRFDLGFPESSPGGAVRLDFSVTVSRYFTHLQLQQQACPQE